MTIAGVSDLDDQVVDYTIEEGGGGGSGTDVPQTFVIAGTDPILIDGGASSDMTTSPITISVEEFDATTDGIVPSPGVATTTFLRADGTWATEATFVGTTPGLVPGGSGASASVFLAGDGTWVAGAVAGVSSITATAAVAASAATGAVALSTLPATLANPGHVPAVGVVDATMSLIRTNPPSWGTVGLTGFIQLQATYPGTAQTGHGHITGTFGAQTSMVAGSTKKSLNGSGSEPLYVKQPNAINPPVIASYVTSATITPGLLLRAARGTETVPVAINSGDAVLRIASSTYIPSAFVERDILTVTAGTSGAGPALGTTLYGWASTANNSYLHLSTGALAGINTFTPASGFEIATTLGLKIIEKTSSFTVDESAEPGCMYLLDPSAGTCRATLHTAGGRTGRVYGFTNINNALTAGISSIRGAGLELINGVNEVFLPSYGDTLWIMSDGTNWVVVHNGIQMHQAAIRSDMSPVGASSTAEVICGSATLYNGTSLGTIFGLRAYGTYSTNGTPNMTFRVRVGSTGGTIMQAFGTATGASSVTDAHWELETSWVVETIVAGACTVGRVLSSRLAIGNAAAALTMYGGTLYTPAAPFGAAGTLGLKLTHQFGTSHADNDVTTRGLATWVQPGTYYAF